MGSAVGAELVEGSALLLGTSLGFKEGDWLSVGSCEGWFDGCILIDGTLLVEGMTDGICVVGEFEIDGKSDGAVLVEGTFVGICEGLIEDCSEGLIEGCVESEGIIDGALKIDG